MNGRTHLIVGVASGLALSYVTSQTPEYMLYFAVAGGVGGIIADIDHPQSIISSFVPFSGLVRLFVGGHRGITHTLLFWQIILGVVAIALPNNHLIIGVFGIGVLSHLIADMFTPRGVPLLSPISDSNFTLLPSQLLAFTAWIWEAVATVGALAVIVWIMWGAKWIF